jgi:hypothetical protein
LDVSSNMSALSARFGRACVDHKVARFRQVDMDDPHVHHDHSNSRAARS